MNTSTKHTRLTAAVITVLALTACQAQAEKASSAKPDPTAQCQQFANSQLKGQQTVSGTTISSSYNAVTGFCTVKVENKTPGSNFYSQVSTNTFAPSSTLTVQTNPEPVHIIWKEEPAPRHLVCKTVTKLKNGQLACDPYHPRRDDFFAPFFTEDSDF